MHRNVESWVLFASTEKIGKAEARIEPAPFDSAA